MRTLAQFLLYVLVVPFAVQGQPPETDPALPGQANQSGGTSKDRLFFALPNFLTLENAGQAPPLTAGDKFKVTVKSAFDPIEFLWEEQPWGR